MSFERSGGQDPQINHASNFAEGNDLIPLFAHQRFFVVAIITKNYHPGWGVKVASGVHYWRLSANVFLEVRLSYYDLQAPAYAFTIAQARTLLLEIQRITR